MGSEQKDKIGAKTRSDLWGIPPERLYSPRSEPTHPEHDEWKERTRLDAPKMIDLIESMRLNGTDEGEPVIYSRDGKTGVNAIADGDRRHAACSFVNAERKADKSLGPQLVLRAIATQDPVLARNLGNACRQDDPPLIRARRYRAAIASMGKPAAAASNGMRLDYANACLACLSLPAEIQAKVNSGELPPDVAARMAKGGAAAAVEAVEAATDKATGKVDPKRAKAAARAAVPTKHRVRPHPKVLANVEAALGLQTRDDKADGFRLGLLWALGADVHDKVSPSLLAVLTDNGWGEGKAAK